MRASCARSNGVCEGLKMQEEDVTIGLRQHDERGAILRSERSCAGGSCRGIDLCALAGADRGTVFLRALVDARSLSFLSLALDNQRRKSVHDRSH